MLTKLHVYYMAGVHRKTEEQMGTSFNVSSPGLVYLETQRWPNNGSVYSVFPRLQEVLNFVLEILHVQIISCSGTVYILRICSAYLSLDIS